MKGKTMNNTRRVMAIGLVVAFAVVSQSSTAETEPLPPRGPVPFSTYDANGDGAVSEEEFLQVRGKRMSARAAEGKPMRGVASAPAFSDFDTSGDGTLTPDELAAGQKKRMEERRRSRIKPGRGAGRGKGKGKGNMPSYEDIDLDGDGSIPEPEFHQGRAKWIANRAKQGAAMKQVGSPPAFGEIDTDGSGAVSREEFEAHQIQHRKSRSKAKRRDK